jgi:hypothetical protein
MVPDAVAQSARSVRCDGRCARRVQVLVTTREAPTQPLNLRIVEGNMPLDYRRYLHTKSTWLWVNDANRSVAIRV